MKNFIIFILMVLNFNALADLEASDSYIDFWEVEIGESEFMEFELTNNFEYPVIITDVDLNADFSAFDLNESCLGILESGDSCYVEVIFSPHEIDDFWGTVEIESNAQERIYVELQGEGVRW